MKFAKILFVLFLLLHASHAFAFDFVNPVGGRSAAMGQTSVCSRGLWAMQNNAAGMSNLKQIGFGCYYENRWMLDATAFKSAVFALPVNFGVIGTSFNQFGYDNYNENKIGLAYSRAFSPFLEIGIQLDYIFLNYGDIYEKQNAFTFEFGLQSQITNKLRLGTYIFNPTNVKTQSLNKERLPVVMRFGLAYEFAKGFLCECEVEKNTSKEGMSLRCGLEYEAVENLYLRVGVQTDENILSFGIGYSLKFVQINIGAQMHEVLGASLQGGMVFNIGKVRP
jgi:hypothetical protein